MKKLLTAVLAALAVCAVLFAQHKPAPSGEEIQIRQLERAWNEAEARHDPVAVTNIVADTLTYIDFDGSVMNKAEYIQDVTKTAYQADRLYDEGLTVTVYGNAAVVVGIYRETVPARVSRTSIASVSPIPGSSKTTSGAAPPARAPSSKANPNVSPPVLVSWDYLLDAEAIYEVPAEDFQI